MHLIPILFRYTGITGSTVNSNMQMALNILYTLLSAFTIVVMFIYPQMFQNDQLVILSIYIAIVWCVYMSCVRYFIQKRDIILLAHYEAELSTEHLATIKHITIAFLLIGAYCLVGIPCTNRNEDLPVVICSVIAGIFFMQFYGICCGFYVYMITFAMGQTDTIRSWLKGLKKRTVSNELGGIYDQYRILYKSSKQFRKLWVNVLLTTFCLLTFRIPISFVLLVYNKFYFEGVMLLFFLLAWINLVLPICELNEQNEFFRNYFIKHPFIIDNKTEINDLVEYNTVRPLGISIYGFTPMYKHLVSVLLIMCNVALPLFFSGLLMSFK